MIRNFKAFGLAVMAAFAMSAVGASAASAEDLFHSDSENTFITGTSYGHHVFDAAGASITCNHASFVGSQVGFTATSITARATYTGCTFIGVGVDVDMGSCAYRFHASGTVDVVDSGGNCDEDKITFHGDAFFGLITCKVEVGEQEGLEHVGYANKVENGKEHVTVTPTVTGISGTATAKGGGCTGGAFSNGDYTTGPTTVKGYSDSAHQNQVDIWTSTT